MTSVFPHVDTLLTHIFWVTIPCKNIYREIYEAKPNIKKYKPRKAWQIPKDISLYGFQLCKLEL